ncbi:MAG: DUF3305 domain-containing protein [Pseudomonadota bacterium]
MARVDQSEVTIPLGVIVERRASRSRWISETWRPVGVMLMGLTPVKPWTVLLADEGMTRYHAGVCDLVLHRKETEALRLNLMLEVPEIYVTLQEGSGEWPWEPAGVTASSFDAQDWEDPGDQIIERVAMPEAVAAFVQAFVEVHHVEETFKKRKRKEHVAEEKQFSKHPIFTPVLKQ